MTGLDSWLTQATRHLAKNSVAQVRSEIQEHYESARADAMSRGATADEADRLAVAALGDAKVANCQYRNVLLTTAEARVLGEGNWEAKVYCSRSSMRWAIPSLALAALASASEFFRLGRTDVAWTLVAGSLAIGYLFTAPLLPIYTPSRGRFFRVGKWVVMVGAFVIILGPAVALKWSWLLFAALWPMAWTDWTRVSIRCKLPIAEWPKQLYL
jgi:hypothetical protein